MVCLVNGKGFMLFIVMDMTILVVISNLLGPSRLGLVKRYPWIYTPFAKSDACDLFGALIFHMRFYGFQNAMTNMSRKPMDVEFLDHFNQTSD